MAFPLNCSPETPRSEDTTSIKNESLKPFNVDGTTHSFEATIDDTFEMFQSPVFGSNLKAGSLSLDLMDLHTPQLPFDAIKEQEASGDSYLDTMGFAFPALDSNQSNVPPIAPDMNWNTFCQLIGDAPPVGSSLLSLPPVGNVPSLPPSSHFGALPPRPFDLDGMLPDSSGSSVPLSMQCLPPSAMANNLARSLPTKRKLERISTPPPSSNLVPTSLGLESPSKKRKLDDGVTKKERRGRPKKGRKTAIKKENGLQKGSRKGRRKKRMGTDSDDELDMTQFIAHQPTGESFVGIKTSDGEVRIQIPHSTNSNSKGPFCKVKFTVFGNACSDRIEDILQPKKRTRYVRGLSEDEKKQRRREQNRNAAARSRARKNAMISKVIQLHQENMGLRAFVAENITQTKLLRDELNRLNSALAAHQFGQSAVNSPAAELNMIPLPVSTAASVEEKSVFDVINHSLEQ